MLSCPALPQTGGSPLAHLLLFGRSELRGAEGRQGGGTADRPPATGHATAPARQPQPRAPQPAPEPVKPRRRLPEHRRRPRPFPFPAGEAQRRASPPPPGSAPPPLAATYRAPDLSRLPPHHRGLSPQRTRATAGGGRATPGGGGGRASPHRPPRPHSGTRPEPPPGGGLRAAAILAAAAGHSLPAGGAPGADRRGSPGGPLLRGGRGLRGHAGSPWPSDGSRLSSPSVCAAPRSACTAPGVRGCIRETCCCFIAARTSYAELV